MTMKDRRCIIISGGELEADPFYYRVLAEANFVICADGGARNAKKLGIVPQIVLGDFDTLTSLELAELERSGARIIRYPRDKDYTDTHLALLKALEMAFSDIVILGALGGRFDHTLANVMLLALPQAGEAQIRIMDPRQELFLVKKEASLKGIKGETISLLPMSSQVCGIKTRGLGYEVPGGILSMGIPIGVSNYFQEEKAVIEIAQGLLLVVRVRED